MRLNVSTLASYDMVTHGPFNSQRLPSLLTVLTHGLFVVLLVGRSLLFCLCCPFDHCEILHGPQETWPGSQIQCQGPPKKASATNIILSASDSSLS